MVSGMLLIQKLLRGIFDSSNEKVGNERRGSMPLVPTTTVDDTNMESGTTSRLANFFIKKGLRTNLKRTKSVTKLDRKRSASNVSETETGKIVTSLKRTMSLGRLSKKSCRIQSAESSPRILSIINSRIRTSRSHESLLINQTNMHSTIELTPDTNIKDLHSSIFRQDNCFHITTTTGGDKFFSCQNAVEKDNWLKCLRKTISPNEENTRRTDNSLKLWIWEAKNIPPKKKYFCEILLDRECYAKTSSKTQTEMLFWGECFEFNYLKPTEMITINLYREADKKKKKDKNALIGYVSIPVQEIGNRQIVEKWFTASSGTVGKSGKESRSELPLVRIRVKYQTVQILPLEFYQDFSKFIGNDYCKLCEILEPMVSVRDKEDIATTLIHVMQKINKAKNFLSDVVMSEISRLDNEHLTFRGNSIATKAMEAYMKLVGEKYLQDTLEDFVKTIVESQDDCEVDPTKVSNNATLLRHQENLIRYCGMVWVKIIKSYNYFPSELREIFASFRERCRLKRKDDISDNLISASIFLRFLCPAILSPSLFSLIQEYPPKRAVRNLTLIAKTIQKLANFTQFGGKEEFMTFMNDFVERESSNMKNFLQQISSSDGGNHFLKYHGYIDLGKELSILHSLLVETLEKANEASLMKLSNLPGILSKLTQALKDPQVGRKQPNRKSQIYDNLTTIPSPPSPSPPSSLSLKESSPTEVIRTTLQQCSESEDFLTTSSSSSMEKQVHHFKAGEGWKPGSSASENFVHYSAFSKTAAQSDVANVSVSSQKGHSNERCVNQSWNQIVTAADVINGESSMISFMDDAHEDLRSSIQLDRNTQSCQLLTGMTSASYSYQSIGYSHSTLPRDSAALIEQPQESPRPVIFTQQSIQPLSFSNPLYRHQRNSQQSSALTLPGQTSSSSSLSSTDDSNTVKHGSPTQSNRSHKCLDPLQKLSQLSSSSSSESLSERFHFARGSSVNATIDASQQHGPALQRINPLYGHKSPKASHRAPFLRSHSQTANGLTVADMSESTDSVFMGPRQDEHLLQMSSADSVLVQECNTLPRRAESSRHMTQSCVSDEFSMYTSSRLLSAQQNSVNMGIRSMQRKLQEQEKTKMVYESEVCVLKQQLVEAQARLHQAEARLMDQKSGTHQLRQDWQQRFEESEERMRKQQAEKDDQMKTIIERLIGVEVELQKEQQEKQKLVVQKQEVIEAQERQIQILDSANNKLMAALNQLKEQYHITQLGLNGLTPPSQSKVAAATMDFAEYKSSAC